MWGEDLAAHTLVELCGFYKTNLRQLVTLLFKTAIILTFQIQFNVNTIYKAINKKINI